LNVTKVDEDNIGLGLRRNVADGIAEARFN
jgi:hypothetical protein